MKLQRDSIWQRRGCSLLWDPLMLSDVVMPSDVVSIRTFFAMTDSWPEQLPSIGGDALIVVGIEGCIDTLSAADAEKWLETDLKKMALRFQEEYEGQAALIFWLPSGRSRIDMEPASNQYYWKYKISGRITKLPIGRCLWAGAEPDAERIIISNEADPNIDGDAWAGLYHPRIS